MIKKFEYTRIEDISDEHKIKTFNSLHKFCLNYAKSVLSSDCEDGWENIHIFEEALEGCLGKKVFDQLNDEGEEYEI